jgi:hypothetical protein
VRKVRRAIWRGCSIAVAALLLAVVAPPVLAKDAALSITSVSQQDLDGDGQPDVTVIDVPFVTKHDRIFVYDTGNDMVESTNWRIATDFDNDTWVYDIGSDGSAQLIVRYGREAGHAVAYVYDDRWGGGGVAFEVSGKQVVVTESPFWTARLVSNGDWLLPDGRVNLNLHADLDGPIATFDRIPAFYVADHMQHDGTSDVAFDEVADGTGNGRYAVKRLLARSPPDLGFERAGLWSNEGRYETAPYRHAFFPFLPGIAADEPADVNLRYFDRPPRLAVDWEKGTITGIRLDGYPIGHGFHFNDSDYIVPGAINNVSFESPQAYYDLLKDRDRFPDVHVRFFTRPAGDEAVWAYPTAQERPWQVVSYDWKLFDTRSLRWDFKLAGAGNYEDIREPVQFGDFAVRMVPFDKLLHWITDRTWKLTTFLAREGDGYDSSEGLYEWMPDSGDDARNSERAFGARDASFAFMLGASATPPAEFFTSTYPGFRAERRFAEPNRFGLYFSPIDHKLHLLGAEAGIWNIDGREQLRYENLGGGSYLDHWVFRPRGGGVRDVYATKDWLIYSDGTKVVLKKATVAPSLFETLPPRDRSEFLSQKQRLLDEAPAFARTDLLAMVRQFAGPEWEIDGGEIREFRRSGDRFRFVLTLRPGFSTQDGDPVRLRGLGAGEYVVTYDRGFEIQRLTPPDLSVLVVTNGIRALRQNAIEVGVTNRGLEDLPGAMVELWAASGKAPDSKVATTTTSVLSGESVSAVLPWAPPAAGAWTLKVLVRSADGEVISQTRSVTVDSSVTASVADIAAATTTPTSLLVVALTLFGLGVLVTVPMYLVRRSRRLD